MPQEPRSFFERLTGARVLSPSNEDEDQHEEELLERDVSYEPRFSNQEVEEAMDETEVEMDEDYSDEDAGGHVGAEEQEGQLTVDVFQDDENIIVQSTIAGVSPDDLDVSITNDMVTIRGERRQQYDADSEDYFYQECYWGTFSRSIILPIEIDADRAEAKIKNGVLTIRIPKANTAVTRKLKVKST
ncbi:MAG: Hsp20/alpha crystallin family protein [Candidatus Andersenbacteria bacterium]